MTSIPSPPSSKTDTETRSTANCVGQRIAHDAALPDPFSANLKLWLYQDDGPGVAFARAW